jgi:hypothetical protein
MATAFPDFQWHFVDDVWSRHRPMPSNVCMNMGGYDFSEFDVYLAHMPLQYEALARRLRAYGIPIHKLIYVSHQGYQETYWPLLFSGRPLREFVEMVSRSPIVCVSHYMVQQYGFYSLRICEEIPHHIPLDLFGPPSWAPGGEKYVNVVNNFHAPYRGVGASFWESLVEIPKALFGADNKPSDCGQLRNVSEFKNVISTARGFLWTADCVAISFAPLEAMGCGCPVIAPDNLDWAKLFVPDEEIILYAPNDKGSLLDVLKKYEGSQELQLSLSRRGQQAIAERFTLERYRRRWSRVFDEALHRD